jgi:hypothetical protein
VLTYNVTYEGLSGPAVAAHIHGPAAPGANGPPVVPFANAASPITGTATLTDAQAADLAAGKWYVNVHTAANKGGEIRGQIREIGDDGSLSRHEHAALHLSAAQHVFLTNPGELLFARVASGVCLGMIRQSAGAERESPTGQEPTWQTAGSWLSPVQRSAMRSQARLCLRP